MMKRTRNVAASSESQFNQNAHLTTEQKQAAKIFLIDDEPIILELFEVYLREGGFQEIFPFTDSVEAVETLRYVTPSVILTDINMPEVSGNFLIKLIRTFDHLRTVPIVAVTSNASEEAHETTVRKGADVVLNKPVDGDILLRTVNQILHSSILLQQQISENEDREQKRMNQKKADQICFESNLRNMMR